MQTAAVACLTLATACFAIFLFDGLTTAKKGEYPMRMAFPFDFAASHYDPARIVLGPEYLLVETIFSPLVEMDVHGSVAPGVATKFEWVGTDAVFTIRENLTTIDGYKITAEDAALSLKRLLVLTGNTHGNIQDLLCHGKKLHSIHDVCDGIAVSGNKLILRPGTQKPFLFPMLAAIDFAVIPARSIDEKSLAIIDYRNTTGTYYVSEDAGGGHITLKANPRHYHYDSQMPLEVKLVPMEKSNPTSSLSALERGDVDIVTTGDAATPEQMLQFHLRTGGKFSLHTSMDIRNVIAVFTERGRELFTPQQRLWIGKKLREAFLKYSDGTLAYKPTKQFFPVFGEGGLSDAQLRELDHAYESVPEMKQLKGKGLRVNIARLALRSVFDQMLQEILPGIEVVDGPPPAFVDYSNDPKGPPVFSISGPDTGFLEDIGLLSYSMAAGFFPIPKAEQNRWLSDYGNQMRKEDRIASLNRIHFASLMDPVIVPLAVAPFVALSNQDWDMQLSKLFANFLLWQIKKK